MTDDMGDAVTREAFERFAKSLEQMADVWQLNDDENVKMMRDTAKQIGLTALLRAALRLLGDPS